MSTAPNATQRSTDELPLQYVIGYIEEWVKHAKPQPKAPTSESGVEVLEDVLRRLKSIARTTSSAARSIGEQQSVCWLLEMREHIAFYWTGIVHEKGFWHWTDKAHEAVRFPTKQAAEESLSRMKLTHVYADEHNTDYRKVQAVEHAFINAAPTPEREAAMENQDLMLELCHRLGAKDGENMHDMLFAAVDDALKLRSTTASKVTQGKRADAASYGVLPDCMIPDGAEPCAAYQYLERELAAEKALANEMIAERDQAKHDLSNCIDGAGKMMRRSTLSATKSRTQFESPFRVGEPEDEDDSSTVLDERGESLTADEIVDLLNSLSRRVAMVQDDLNTAARHRDEYRERAYAAEMGTIDTFDGPAPAVLVAAEMVIRLHGGKPAPDHACARCLPQGTGLVPGFVCAFHRAEDAMCRSDSAEGKS
jgi:hypothetical protein